MYGTVGYMVLEGYGFVDAVYMTVTTLTAVGFGEVEPLDSVGRLFTLSLIVVGISALFTLLAVLTSLVASGQFGRSLTRRSMRRRTDTLRGHYVVCAFGRVGRSAVEELLSEGAEVVVVRGMYDEAVARSAEEADERCLVISDTSWPGYEEVPRWVIDGYSTILWEVEDELGRLGEGGPTLVVVQIGVGAFAAAVARHFRSLGVSPRPKILGVEPARAACALASAEAGGIVHLPGPHDSIMAGLNCGSPSVVAWPVISKGIDVFVEIEDGWAREAMRMLAGAGIVSGETGAAGLAGLLALTREGDRGELGLTGEARVLVFNCEGATDPGAYGRIVSGTDVGAPHASP